MKLKNYFSSLHVFFDITFNYSDHYARTRAHAPSDAHCNVSSLAAKIYLHYVFQYSWSLVMVWCCVRANTIPRVYSTCICVCNCVLLQFVAHLFAYCIFVAYIYTTTTIWITIIVSIASVVSNRQCFTTSSRYLSSDISVRITLYNARAREHVHTKYEMNSKINYVASKLFRYALFICHLIYIAVYAFNLPAIVFMYTLLYMYIHVSMTQAMITLCLIKKH